MAISLALLNWFSNGCLPIIKTRHCSFVSILSLYCPYTIFLTWCLVSSIILCLLLRMVRGDVKQMRWHDASRCVPRHHAPCSSVTQQMHHFAGSKMADWLYRLSAIAPPYDFVILLLVKPCWSVYGIAASYHLDRQCGRRQRQTDVSWP